jgi:hypothetical protein
MSSSATASPPANKAATLRIYTPHAGQKPLHASQARFNYVNFGRQSGKTTYGLNKILSRAWTGPRDGIYWYILQTHRAAEVAFNRAFKFYRNCPRAFDKKPNESTKSMRLFHGPEIHFLSGGNFEDLRIETLTGMVIDEVRQQSPGLWAVVRPMLAVRHSYDPRLGWCDFLSTPNGYDHWFDLCEQAKKEIIEMCAKGITPEAAYFEAPSSCAPWWTEAELASARRTMSADMYAQEILAQFRNLMVGQAFGCYSSANCATETPLTTEQYRLAGGLLAPNYPIVVAPDFNVSPMAWPIMQHTGGRFYAFDMVWLERTSRGTFEAAEVLVAKLINYGIKNITIIGDAAGKQNKTSAAGETDYSIMCERLNAAGIRWENATPEANPMIRDRVNTTNSRLQAADGTISFWLHPVNCAPLKRDFERTTWADLAGKPKDPLIGHAVSGVGYALHVLDPLRVSGSDDFKLFVLNH